MNLGQPARILVSAGEPSGDQHGAGVVAALRAASPGLECEGPGGPAMASAGMTLRCPIDRLSAIGFVEAARTLPRHLGLLRELSRDARSGRYRAAVLIDYPGFHLRLGRALRRAGVPVIWYIAPQLWAWWPGRLPRLQAAADRLAVILPFEAGWFGARGMATDFVGHPLLDRTWSTPADARARLDLPSDAPVLGIFPGVREGELTRNWPLFREVGKQLLAQGHANRVIVAGTAGGYYPDAGQLQVHRGEPELVLAASTAALIKSGTTSLEAARAGTPMVVAYRSSRSTYAIARRVLRVPWISLVNLVAERPVVPEFWHLPVRADEVSAALRPLLDRSEAAHLAQLEALAQVRAALGQRGAAERVARMVLQRVG